MEVECPLQVATPLSDFRDGCAFGVGRFGSVWWWWVWPRIVWIEKLGSQSERAGKEAGEMLHFTRGAHLKVHRISDVEQVPCDRKIEQMVNNTINGFEVCGPGAVPIQSRPVAKSQTQTTYTYSATELPSSRRAGTV